MPELDAYLFFNGNCAEAMRFYERMLGAKIEMMMTYGESPEKGDGPPPPADKIMHARLRVGDAILMASDDCGADPHEGMKGFSLSLSYPTAAEAKRVFGTLADGGETIMPFSETFWSDGFGMVVDRFGAPWMIGGGMKTM